MANVIRTIILIITTLFPIVNPLGNAPLFLSLTQSGTAEERWILSRKVAQYSFFLLLGSILIAHRRSWVESSANGIALFEGLPDGQRFGDWNVYPPD
jgi:hypothetical protein